MAYEKMFKHFKVIRSFSSVLTKRTYNVTNKNGYFVAWRGNAYGFVIPKVFTADKAVDFVINSIS